MKILLNTNQAYEIFIIEKLKKNHKLNEFVNHIILKKSTRNIVINKIDKIR